MKHTSAEQALKFVNDLSLPPRRAGTMAVAKPIDHVFDSAKNQTMIVASDIVSFVQGITPERREDIVNCTLLAQLGANAKVTDLTRIKDWYNAYFDILTNIGWVIQDQGFSEYSETSAGFEAHKAILDIAATLLGPGATAVAVIKSALDALKSMASNDNPWITLFDSESKWAKTARFQVTLAEPAKEDQFLVALLAFALEARSTLTQVLFFKFRANEATLKHSSGKVTINADVLSSIRDAIKKKLAGFAGDYVMELKVAPLK